MSFCWLGSQKPLGEILLELGHTKQSLKKSEVAKKSLERLIKCRGEVSLPASLMNRGGIYPKYSPHHQRPIILEERVEILAVSKPSMVHCHPLHYGENDNLLSFLREEKYFSYLAINEEKMDRGLLYRLDYETSGLILLTSNSDILERAREGKLLKSKVYQVLVEGDYEGPKELVHKISTTGKKIKEDSAGKEVHLKVLKSEYLMGQNRTLLEVELKEGARHQIRVQLALAGYPIVGDELYGGIPSDVFGLHSFRYETTLGVFQEKRGLVSF